MMMLSVAKHLSPRFSRASTFVDSNVSVDRESEVLSGEQLTDSLDCLLEKVRKERLTVDERDQELLNRCFAPGNPEPEFTGEVTACRSFHYLESLTNALKTDPRGRSHVVDHFESDFTEDSFWLSLPKWQATFGLNDIQWSIVTMRSIDRCVFRESFQGWEVKHVHGTAMVSNNSQDCQVLFSDQPRMVAHHGREMGAGSEALTIRVFRCAPRPALMDGIAAVLAEECPNNVFDIWIRHHEAPDNVSGFGRYKHALGADVTLLELLTDIDMSELPSSTPISAYYSTSSSGKAGPYGIDILQEVEIYADAEYNADLDSSIDDDDEDDDISLPSLDPRNQSKTPIAPHWSPLSPAVATHGSPWTEGTSHYSLTPERDMYEHRPLPDPLIDRFLSERHEHDFPKPTFVTTRKKFRGNKKKNNKKAILADQTNNQDADKKRPRPFLFKKRGVVGE